MAKTTKAHLLAPKRKTEELKIPEFDAPLLVAEMSGGAALRLRQSKVELGSDEGLTAMVADMLVDESGARLFSPEEVPGFLDGISLTSTTALIKKCLEMQAPGGDPGNSKPSTSAA